MALADSSEAVLAGSPAFLGLALPPLAAALGVRPRVADAPHQVFALCQDGARLLVFEYRGLEWLPLAEDLKTTFGDELKILVAVPAEHAGAIGPLIGAGVEEAMRWDGAPGALVAAAVRLTGSPAAPAPASSRPAVGPPTPAPALAPPPFPRPALTPVKPVPAVTPVRPAAAVAPAAPRLGVAGGAALASAPAFFEDLEDEPGFAIVEAPPDARARWGDADLVAFERSSTWPGTVLASRDAEGLLAGALAGFWPQGDLKAHTERVVAELSPLERDAIAGRPVPADPAPVCRAAALRWQVSAALVSAPAPGSPVDSAAVRGILAEIDAVLAELKRVSQGAPAEALPGLEQLRRGLVAEAVDLTETVHRIAPQEAPGVEPAPGAAALSRTRLLTMKPSDAPAEREERRRGAGGWGARVLAVAVAAAYHGWGFLRPAPPPMPRPPGAPAGFVAPPTFPGGVRLYAPENPAAAPDRAEIDKFRSTEELKGNKVQEVGGVLLVVPEADAASAGGLPARGKRGAP
jgi:hypothetical protein